MDKETSKKLRYIKTSSNRYPFIQLRAEWKGLFKKTIVPNVFFLLLVLFCVSVTQCYTIICFILSFCNTGISENNSQHGEKNEKNRNTLKIK